MPYSALTQLLANGPGEDGSAVTARTLEPSHMRQHATSRPVLTSRQTAVLDLMAEGHGNAVIARTLSCSEHTVKNTIYDLMSRLQARNRAHAVAHGLRHGLI
ncbi:response regulator transcription factor [Streptacidiphilus melanogenes]|uniref:response regulator transcription factor n=1 Tax=Streptacidiphilus melanogenes TaxID=411235 RepID=UPI0009FD841D|nr:LuxR C-terminal-related transcriptional regulator [Streptacidiphilus melanogenes]